MFGVAEAERWLVQSSQFSSASCVGQSLQGMQQDIWMMGASCHAYSSTLVRNYHHFITAKDIDSPNCLVFVNEKGV